MFNTLKKTINGIIAIAQGMLTVAKHAFRKPITLEYPEQKPELNSRFRGRVALLVNENGFDRCIACGSCAKVCPCGDLIHIKKAKNEHGKFYPEEFTIDIGRCIFCGNCEQVCPTDAIVLTKKYELADYSRESMVLDKNHITLSLNESADVYAEKQNDKKMDGQEK